MNRIFLKCLALIACSLFGAATLKADSHKNATGAYVHFSGGPFVHKSDTVNGTDFANLLSVEVGTNYGKRKDFGLAIHNDRMTTDFRQTNSSMKTEFTEFRMSYRQLWFIPQLIMGHGTLNATSTDPALAGEIANLAFIYVGGGLDLEFPYSSLITVHTKLRSVNFTSVHDKSGRDSSMTSRNELDIGIRFQLPLPVVYLTGGYMHRSWAMDIAGSGSKSQVQTGPYLGLLFGHEF